jgi:hypothetical protein
MLSIAEIAEVIDRRETREEPAAILYKGSAFNHDHSLRDRYGAIDGRLFIVR